MFKVAGRYLDKTWRRFRPYLLPEFKQAYQTLMQQAQPLPAEGKLVVFDFHSNRIDGPQGRRFFNLFTFFTRAGYFPVFIDHYAFLANPRNNFKAECFKHPFAVIDRLARVCQHPAPVLLISDQPVYADGPAPSETPTDNSIQRFTVSLAVDERIGPNEFPWPFPMFPGLYRLNQDETLGERRLQPRPWRFFFGGQSASHKYDKNWVRGVYGKVTRGAYLDIARETLEAGPGVTEPKSDDELKALITTPVAGGVLVYNEHCKIPPDQWLATIARSRFFFACPGVRYPMSHNAVEALAVGSVPIIEYPEDFHPNLEDGVNCLTFSGEAGLKAAINRAVNLSDAEWQKLSANAIDYYEHNLSPEAAINRLLTAHQEGADTIKLVPFLKKGGGHI